MKSKPGLYDLKIRVCTDTEASYVLELQVCTCITDGKSEVSQGSRLFMVIVETSFWFLDVCFC